MCERCIKKNQHWRRVECFCPSLLQEKKRELLNAAIDCYGKFNAWSDKGQVLANVPGQSALRRIKTMAD